MKKGNSWIILLSVLLLAVVLSFFPNEPVFSPPDSVVCQNVGACCVDRDIVGQPGGNVDNCAEKLTQEACESVGGFWGGTGSYCGTPRKDGECNIISGDERIWTCCSDRSECLIPATFSPTDYFECVCENLDGEAIDSRNYRKGSCRACSEISS